MALVVLLTVYLGLKTLPEDGWSGWGEQSAQTLLSIEHWAQDGFLENKLLFVPVGYSKVARYLDDPSLRHHARGTVTGYLIGKRLYYTHYPSGYMIPFALLRKAGVTERYAFRLLGLSFSIAALFLMYVFFNRISDSTVAFFGALYYGLSTMFLDFADSLANQPIDDLLRFAVLAVSVSAYGRAEARGSRVLVIWFLFLALSLSSCDSTLFIFAWLIGLDIAAWLSDREAALPWKRWLFYLSAPVIAFSAQMLQNWWYLGWEDLFLDLKGVVMSRTSARARGLF